MRFSRICIGAAGLALGTLVVSVGGAGAAAPCPPGQPPGRGGGRPPTVGPPPGRPPQYPIGKCQLQLSAASVTAGRSVSARGGGFSPGSAVALSLGSTALGTATADGSGGFTQSITVPLSTTPGQFDVRATGVSAATPYELTAPLEVLPADAAAAPIVGGGPLRSGAGLAAGVPRAGNGSGSSRFGGGLAAGPIAGGGVVALPGTLNPGAGADVKGTTFTDNGNGVSGAIRPTADGLAGSSAGGPATGSGSSGGLSPFVFVGGGLALLAAGGAAAVAAKRHKTASQP